MLYTVKRLYYKIRSIDYIAGICYALSNGIANFFLNNTTIFIEKEINAMKFEISCKTNKKAKKAKQRWIIKDLQTKMQKCLNENDFATFMKHKTLYESYMTTFEGTELYQLAFKLPQLPTDRSFDELGVKKPNHYFDIIKNWYNVKNDHVPLKSNFGLWIGVEIECYIPKETLEVNTKTRIVDSDDDEDDDFFEDSNVYRNYIIDRIQKEKIKFVSVKSDGSIECDDSSKEIALEFTVLTRINNMSNLMKLCKLLNTFKAKVNKSCGLHIHLDQRDIQNDTKALSKKVMRLNQCLELLKSVVPKSRLNNSYCITDRAKLTNPSRYYAINTEAIEKFGTIEIRLHSGTTDFIKISNWIKLCYGISNAKDIKNSSRHVVTTIEQLKEKYIKNLPDDCVEYFKSRAELFKKETQKEVEISDSEGNTETITESELQDYDRDNTLVATAEAVIRMSNNFTNSDFSIPVPQSRSNIYGRPEGVLQNSLITIDPNYVLFTSTPTRQEVVFGDIQVSVGDLDTNINNGSNDEGNS